MELIPIQQINDQFLSYKDLRSVRNWISANGLKLITIGRGKFVEKNALETVIKNLAGIDEATMIIPIKLKQIESNIYTDLRERLNEL